MIFKSSEMRWFSHDYDLLWDFFDNLPEKGRGTQENVRTDYYLNSNTENTGIKIREGNHEIKVKCADDDILEFGFITHWVKWSVSEKKNILNTIDNELLGEWVPVKKKRIKKTFEVVSDSEVKFAGDKFAEEGVGVEFTEVYLGRPDKPIYTVGFEAFSASNQERENLMCAIKHLGIELTLFENLDSYGYPQLLKKFGNELK